MADVDLAFKFKTPAIISSHRINFIDSTPLPNGSKSGIHQLKELLDKILKKWPNVEFMSSRDLSSLMHKDN